MCLQELLMKARQDALLQEAARYRLAADARHARRGVPTRPGGRTGWHRFVLLMAWARSRPSAACSARSLPESGAR